MEGTGKLASTTPDAPPPPDAIDRLIEQREALIQGAHWHVDAEETGAPDELKALTGMANAFANDNIGGIDARGHYRALLGQVAAKHRAECILTTLADAASPDFTVFERNFRFSGEVRPQISERQAYFSSISNTRTAESYRTAEPLGEHVVLHIVANVFSGASDNFYIRLFDAAADADEAIRLGTLGATVVRDNAFFEFPGKTPRLYSLAVSGGVFSLYVNGILIWRRRRTRTHRPIGFGFDLLSYGAWSTDGCLFDFELWRLDAPFPGFVDDATVFAPIPERLLRDRKGRLLYDLLNAIPDLMLQDSGEAALGFLRDITASRQGYAEWLNDIVVDRLDESTRQRWLAERPRFLPPPVIEVSDLVVELSRNQAGDASLMRMLSRRQAETFNVLDGIDFRLYQGDIVGIIGHNGAGKSTLLRAMAGLMPIVQGRIAVRGNFMLLRAGLGVRPELTGRQNILSAGIYLGLSVKEITSLTPGIIEFSELGDHIDRPVKYYSDGMLSRLTFSIATSISPEILYLDELLGAGDVGFQDKAQRRLHDLIKQARLVVLVTHSIGFVRNHCNKALVLSGGKQIFFGEPKAAVTRYLNDLHMSQTARIIETF